MRRVMLAGLLVLAGLLLSAACGAVRAAPFCAEEWVIPRETFFNHAPCIVELPDGDLLISWYHGAKGNKDDDVLVEGARKPDGARSWGERFVMADTPGYPDGNACMVLDSQNRLLFFWPTLLANSWVSALMKYRVSTNFGMSDSPPVWAWQDVLHVTPVDLEQQINAAMERFLTAHPEIKERNAEQLEGLPERGARAGRQQAAAPPGLDGAGASAGAAVGAGDRAAVHRCVLDLGDGDDR